MRAAAPRSLPRVLPCGMCFEVHKDTPDFLAPVSDLLSLVADAQEMFQYSQFEAGVQKWEVT